MLRVASEAFPGAIHISSLGRALAVSLLAAAATMVITILAGMDDDDEYTLRVTQRIARRSGNVQRTDVPGVIYLEIDGLGLPVLQRAMRDGNAPEMARWLAEGSHHMVEWQTDLSSQTGASQAGILLGSNQDIPAFRWVEKSTGRVVACSGPDDCAEMEKRLATGAGLLVGGGASRGNLFSGEADATILTVSRLSAEKTANPGYRSFFANGFNVTRVLVLFFFEVGLEWVAAIRGIRRDVQPRGHRGGKYPFIRAGMCVVVRDLIVHGVLSDMMHGRAAVYATFSSYDEVAHHSGLERADTLEALRKLDEQFGRIMRACPYAPRPYRIVVLSDHGQTQGATFRQRNGYGLDDLVRRSLESGSVGEMSGAEEAQAMVGHALTEATGRDAKDPDDDSPAGEDVIVLGSGNLGLLYLMNHPERLTLEQIESEHPRLIPALRAHPHVGWLLVRSGLRPGGAGRDRQPRPGVGHGRGRRSAGAVRAGGGAAPGPHRRLLQRRRHHDRQLLQLGPRAGLRVRGADQLPRRAGRAADAAVHPLPGRAGRPTPADPGRRAGARDPVRLAPRPAGGVRARGDCHAVSGARCLRHVSPSIAPSTSVGTTVSTR